MENFSKDQKLLISTKPKSRLKKISPSSLLCIFSICLFIIGYCIYGYMLSQGTYVDPQTIDQVPPLQIGLYVFLVLAICAGVVPVLIQLNKNGSSRETPLQQPATYGEIQNQTPLNIQTKYVNAQDDLIDKQRLERLRDIIQVSKRLKVKQLAIALGMNESSLLQRLFQWAKEFGFTIDNDVIEFTKGRTEEFITSLEKEFATWGNSGKA